MPKTVEARALEIAATCLVAADCCRFDDRSKCRYKPPTLFQCRICIQRWLLAKARKEMEGER